jgi:hypothetical protein
MSSRSLTEWTIGVYREQSQPQEEVCRTRRCVGSFLSAAPRDLSSRSLSTKSSSFFPLLFLFLPPQALFSCLDMGRRGTRRGGRCETRSSDGLRDLWKLTASLTDFAALRAMFMRSEDRPGVRDKCYAPRVHSEGRVWGRDSYLILTLRPLV